MNRISLCILQLHRIGSLREGSQILRIVAVLFATILERHRSYPLQSDQAHNIPSFVLQFVFEQDRGYFH